MKAKFFTNTDNSVIIYLRQEEIRHTGVLFPVMRLSEVAVMTGIRPVRMNSLNQEGQACYGRYKDDMNPDRIVKER